MTALTTQAESALISQNLTTSSLRIAEAFGKRHKDVLRRIENMEIDDAYRQRNFAPTFRTVPGPKGSSRQEPAYELTRDGFALLVMGFTGQKAMAWKIRFLEAFNEMERRLSGHSEPLSATEFAQRVSQPDLIPTALQALRDSLRGDLEEGRKAEALLVRHMQVSNERGALVLVPGKWRAA